MPDKRLISVILGDKPAKRAVDALMARTKFESLYSSYWEIQLTEMLTDSYNYF